MDLSKLGGGGVSVTSFFSATVILAAGASGNLITITPPAGKRVILNALMADGTINSGITISGSLQGNIVTSKTLNSTAQAVNTFCVGQSSNTSTAINNAGWIPSIVGDIDEVLTVKKDTGATLSAINYSYEYRS